jgi:DNA-binding CsgD family transcriptional regulator
MTSAALSLANGAHGSERGAARLTDRQREVLARLRRGLSNKEIAAELGITEEGVKAHLGRLYLRFGVRNRVQLVTEAGADLDGLDPGARLESLRTMAIDARQDMNSARSRPRAANGTVDAQLESMRIALESLDVALELVSTLPPNTAGKALRVVRRRMSAVLGALRALEAAVT